MKIYFQKRFKKVCEIRKRELPLHPAKSALFLEKLTRIKKRSRKIYFSKKLFKTLARTKRNVTFAAANREVGKNKEKNTFLDILN